MYQLKNKFAPDRKDSLRINGKISRSRRAVYFVAYHHMTQELNTLVIAYKQ